MMDGDLGNSGDHAFDNDVASNTSVQVTENNACVTNDGATCTENDTNLGTSSKTEHAALQNVDTVGAMESNNHDSNSDFDLMPITTIKQGPVTGSSDGALSVEMDVVPNITTTSDSVQETVASEENVTINALNEIQTEIKSEEEDCAIVLIEDMEVAATTPAVATTDNPTVVLQSAITSPSSAGLVQKCGALSNITQYRGDSSDDLSSDSDSDSSTSSSSSSSSSSSEPLHIVLEEDDPDEGLGKGKSQTPIKSQDEVLIDELPAVEDLHISLPEEAELRPMGLISSVVDKLVIVESFRDAPPLNDDSVVFNADREAVGKVFEVFGPVVQPFYALRFNSDKDIANKKLKPKDTVYFAPGVKDLTDYIFTDRLRLFKGSDASWKNDQEPPPEALDFSDDELEAQAKKNRKLQRQENAETDGDKEKQKPGNKRPPKREPRQPWSGPRPKGPPNPRAAGPPHGPRPRYPHYLQNPHFRPPPPSPRMDNHHHAFRQPPPFQAPPPYFPMYPAGPPPPHMPWPPHAFPGMFMPPPPPPPPPPPHHTNGHWPN